MMFGSLSGSGHVLSEAKSIRAGGSNEFFQKIYKQAATGIAITDWQGNFQECNPAYCALLGYTEAELRGIDFALLVHPEDRETNVIQVRRLQAGEIPSFEIENRYIHKNGEPVWVRKFVTALAGETGEPEHMVALVTETTKHHAAMQALRESEERYRGLAEQVLDGIFVCDSQGRYLDANRAGCEMLGYTLEELQTFTIPDVIPPDERLRLPEQFRRLASGQIVRNDWRFRRKDGSDFIGELVARQFSDGRFQGVLRDVTERRQAEAALRQQALLDLSPNGILIRDYEGRISFWNEGAAQLYGWSKEEAMGQLAHALLQTQFPEPLDTILETLKRTGRWDGELVHTCRDGRRITVESRWVIQPDAGGEGCECVEMNTDITVRKRAEASLRDEGRRKDEFLAVLGHELRNPLAAIATALQVLSSEGTSEQRAELEEVMGRQVALMRRLLDDLLDLGRITHGHIELKKESIDLTSFLQKTAASVQSTIANRRQELLLRLPPDPVQFMADQARLEQIATNLLSNASKYTAQAGRIEFSGGKEGSDVVLRCKDNGQGILPECQNKIFEPFTRGRNDHDSFGEASLGIGLALVKQLTELHGGTVAVESGGAGMGSEFTVRLPLSAPTPGPTAVEPKPVRSSHHSRSVVVVEDNPMVAKLMGIVLRRAGHKMYRFSDGPSALAGVAELKPDAVLLDIGLPGMNGYELAAALKRQRNMKDTLFIALSGFKRREQAGEVDNFDYYFTKPVDVPALLALLDTRCRAAAEAAREHRELDESGPLRVLLAEDHADLAASMAKLLRSQGLEVETVLTGRKALEAVAGFQPQLVLCDMNLPDMKGLEVIRGIRSNPSTQQAHAVILTAMSEIDIRTYNSNAKKLGVDEFISKPVTPEVIRTLVAKLKPSGRVYRRDRGLVR